MSKNIEQELRRDGQDNNESCPRFVALVSDSYVEASDDLDELIATVRQDGMGSGEDCCIWQDFHRVAALVLADGTVQRFGRQPEPKPAQDDVDARLKAVFVTRRSRK